jgi:hypothetical protein
MIRPQRAVMTKPTILLPRAVLVGVLAFCLWTAAEAKAAAGYLMVPPRVPRAAGQAKAPNVCVAGRIVEPSGSQTTFAVTLGGDPNLQY